MSTENSGPSVNAVAKEMDRINELLSSLSLALRSSDAANTPTAEAARAPSTATVNTTKTATVASDAIDAELARPPRVTRVNNDELRKVLDAFREELVAGRIRVDAVHQLLVLMQGVVNLARVLAIGAA